MILDYLKGRIQLDYLVVDVFFVNYGPKLGMGEGDVKLMELPDGDPAIRMTLASCFEFQIGNDSVPKYNRYHRRILLESNI